MLRLLNISLDLDYNNSDLINIASKKLNIPKKFITNVSLHKKSIDARKKHNIHFLCSIDVELSKEVRNYKKYISNNIMEVFPYIYKTEKCINCKTPPLIVGFGPAGIFASLILAEAGCNPIIIERGKDVDNRTKDINNFWNNSTLNVESNVQFGEGGAGTFSDGKLNTGVKDSRSRKVLQEFVNCGAPEDILYTTKPHIGTDKLKTTVKNLRKKIISLGAKINFETKLLKIVIKNNKVTSAIVQSQDNIYEIGTDNIILAIGHSARDSFTMLNDLGIFIEPKPFSVGARIEHLQQVINKSQYGIFHNHHALGAADYKLSVHLKNGRGVYTFCMCPGGQVVAAASEKGKLVTNSMSEYKRNKTNANSAILVGITPDDFESDHPLAGVEFQRKLEEKAFVLGGSNYKAPVQLVGDFLKDIPSKSIGSVVPSYKPGYNLCNISSCFPQYITDSLKQGIIEMNKKINGFSAYDAVLTAVETRSSSPIRITRNECGESINLSGLYPCGEGAGYAGGIMSAAIDGIKTAENIINKIKQKEMV